MYLILCVYMQDKSDHYLKLNIYFNKNTNISLKTVVRWKLKKEAFV